MSASNYHAPPQTYMLPVHPNSVGMVIGKHGATIKKINQDQVGWAHVRFESPRFVIRGHPTHVTTIAIAINEIAMEAKHRNQLGTNKPQKRRPPPLSLAPEHPHRGPITPIESQVPSSPDYKPPSLEPVVSTTRFCADCGRPWLVEWERCSRCPTQEEMNAQLKMDAIRFLPVPFAD